MINATTTCIITIIIIIFIIYVLHNLNWQDKEEERDLSRAVHRPVVCTAASLRHEHLVLSPRGISGLLGASRRDLA